MGEMVDDDFFDRMLEQIDQEMVHLDPLVLDVGRPLTVEHAKTLFVEALTVIRTNAEAAVWARALSKDMLSSEEGPKRKKKKKEEPPPVTIQEDGPPTYSPMHTEELPNGHRLYGIVVYDRSARRANTSREDDLFRRNFSLLPEALTIFTATPKPSNENRDALRKQIMDWKRLSERQAFAQPPRLDWTALGWGQAHRALVEYMRKRDFTTAALARLEEDMVGLNHLHEVLALVKEETVLFETDGTA